MEEEQKIEEINNSSPRKEFFGPFHHCHCTKHKMLRCLLKALLILIIFSIGVCVGSHRGFERGDRFENNNFRHQRNGGMIQQWGGNRAMIQRGYNGRMQNGGFQGNNFQNGFQDGNAGYQIQGTAVQVQDQGIVTPATAQTIIKVIPATSTPVVPKK